ncbi:MAG: DUF2799 domain-containing protein [Pseudomonadota bacterium]
MNSKSAALALIVAALGLSGCASMSSEECATSDWRAVGYEDGSRGYASEQFGKHRKACAKHGYTADFAAYQQGRDAGLVEYCQPSRGFNVGASGSRYHGVCPVEMEGDFLDAYRAGHQLYTLRSNVSSAENAIRYKESELDSLAESIGQAEALLISDATTSEERVLLLSDLKRMSERTGELENEIDALIHDLAAYEAELFEYEQAVAAFGY